MARDARGRFLKGSGTRGATAGAKRGTTRSGPAAGPVFTIQDLSRVLKSLERLEPKVARKVLRQALRKALKPIKARAEQLAPMGPTKQTAKNIKILAARRTRKKEIRLRVVIGKGYFVGEQFYAGFVELGTKRSGLGYYRRNYPLAGRTKQPGQKAQHFLKRAGEQKAFQSRQIAIAEIRAGIEREARR